MKFLIISIYMLLFTMAAQSQTKPTYKDSEATVVERVEDLIGQMTIYEKIGQMTQLDITLINKTGNQRDVALNEEKAIALIKNHHIGSFLNGEAVPPEDWFKFMNHLSRLAIKESRLDIPIIYGIDHIHGASYLEGSTIFPQNINLGATFNPEHTYNTAWVTALESADLGHHWNFAPVLDLGVHPQWPRIWETFGEDPHLASVLAARYVDGFQNNDETQPYKSAATAKHFIGYSDPKSGWDRTPVHIGMQALHEFHRPAFQAAVDAGIKTVMVNSGELNGIPVHASHELLTGLLRDQMGFEGVIVTDWDDVGKLEDFHKTAENYKEAAYQAVMAGIDVNMVPLSLQFNEVMMELVEEGRITEERIDESVRRILKLKFDLGLFEHPYPRDDRFHRIGSEENRLKALDAAKESIVLLRNRFNTLPSENPSDIVVLGPSANSKRNLSGGWTLAWQGGKEEQYPDDMHTLFSALVNEYPNATVELIDHIPSEPSVQFFDTLSQADLMIYAGGEEPYTEFVGNINDLALPANQLEEIRILAETTTPLAVVLIQGRPRLISSVIEHIDVFIHAGLPGFEGGEAIASVISGRTNPSGKLPVSYPQYKNHFVNYHHKSSDIHFFDPEQANQIMLGNDKISLFKFGDGLSYTTFEYTNLELSSDYISPDEVLTASVTVANRGKRAGLESVLWFITDEVASITRPDKLLKHFEKIELKPGESKTVTFDINPKQSLSFPDKQGNLILEPGLFIIQVGSEKAEFTLHK